MWESVHANERIKNIQINGETYRVHELKNIRCIRDGRYVHSSLMS